MKDPQVDELRFKCPLCRKSYLGKHINNPYTPICDWCALGLMLTEADGRPTKESAVVESN